MSELSTPVFLENCNLFIRLNVFAELSKSRKIFALDTLYGHFWTLLVQLLYLFRMLYFSFEKKNAYALNKRPS